jgi:PadR family transcriptional regulator PadR
MRGKCKKFKGAMLLDAYILLFLRDEPNHGYNLVQKLNDCGLQINEPTIVYRQLKQLENMNYIYSKIFPSEEGPPKKVFYITKLGILYLEEISNLIKERINILNKFINEYERSGKNENSNSAN